MWRPPDGREHQARAGHPVTGKPVIVSAAWTEAERDAHLGKDRNQAWRTKAEVIVDIEKAQKEARAKLNGLDQ